MTHRKVYLFVFLWLSLCLYLSYLVYGNAKSKAIEDLNSRQFIHAKQAARGIEAYFEHWISVLKTMAKKDDVIMMTAEGKDFMEFLLKAHHEEIQGITRMDADGRIVHTLPYMAQAIGTDLSGQQHVRETLNTREPVVSDVFRAVQGFDAIAIHVPLFKDKTFLGTIAVLLDFKVISKRFLDVIRLGETGYAWMTSAEGIELYCPVPGHTGNSVFENCKDFPSIISMAGEMVKGRQGVSTYSFDRIKDERVETIVKHAVYMPIQVGSSFWSVVVASSEMEVLASLESFKNRLILVVGVLLIGAVLFSYFGMRTWGIVKEVRKRLEAEEALRRSEERYRTIIENAVSGIYQVTESGRFIMVNQKMADILGYDSTQDVLESVNITDIYVHPEERPGVLKKMREEGFIEGKQTEFKRKNGERFWGKVNARATVGADGNTIYEGLLEDITELKNMEAQLRQSRKMESIGTLAGGIAHEFNNILGIILGNTELAIDDVPEWNPAHGFLKEVIRASLRAKDIVKQLLSFSRKSEEERAPVDIIPIIKESLKLLRSSIPAYIEFRPNIPNDPCVIAGDATQIHQVMINLCKNAADAMGEAGGILEVSIEKIAPDRDEMLSDADVFADSYVKITVKDTGCGISPKDLESIFDPYFTTKPVGQGTGMGLSVVHGIVKGHDGLIRANSEPGKGTTISIFFPVIASVVQDDRHDAGELPAGDESVLFVDDEESIVAMGRRQLERLGYHVDTFLDPTEALETFRADPNRYDIIITDMAMPHMTGDELVKNITDIRPAMPVIVCTGFSERINEDNASKIGVSALIMKPVDIREMATKVREVLDNISIERSSIG